MTPGSRSNSYQAIYAGIGSLARMPDIRYVVVDLPTICMHRGYYFGIRPERGDHQRNTVFCNDFKICP